MQVRGHFILSKEKNKLKYHYTSPNALLSILKNHQIYYTDIRFLNDKSEDIYLVKLILDLLDENEKEYPNVREVTNVLFKNNRISDLQSLNAINIDYSVPLDYIPMRKFVFCTTTESDQLNMWNYYVHNGKYQGYNIRFNIEKLLKSFDTEKPKTADPFSVVYGKVLYDKKKQCEEILRLFEELEIRKNFSQSLDYLVVELRHYIDSYGAFFKNPSYKTEKEYRICIEIDDKRLREDKSHFSGTHNRKMKYDYRTSNGLIVPYIAVEFEKEAVSTIHMSPMTEFQIAKESIREVLNDYRAIKDNKQFVKFIADMKLLVRDPDGATIPVIPENIVGYDDNVEYLITKHKIVSAKLASLSNRISVCENQRQSESEQLSFWESETLTQAFDRKIASVQINAVVIDKEIKRLEKELKSVRRAITDFTRINNPIVTNLYQNVLKYAVELGIGSDTTIAASYLFTSNLKELSGALLHKTVFAFRLAYIIEIEKALGIRLPIILDSPSGKEIDQENIKLMINILKRDFSDHQIIIASIFEYDINPINTIEIKDRLIE